MRMWECGGGRCWDLENRGLILGIVNVTPDSFSDGGAFLDPDQAIAHGRQLAAEGADLLDVGGESTRPGSDPVPAEEEMRRVLPVVQALAGDGLAVSIDTTKAIVAEAALKLGACVVNDVSGLRGDPEMLSTVARSDCGVVIMHMRGTPKEMQRDPSYTDVVAEVAEFLEHQVDAATEAGIGIDRIVVDPGIGFGKRLEHNVALLRHIGRLEARGRPVLIGVSRKSFIGKLLGSATVADLDWSTVALTSFLREQGARIFRVHAVRANRDALRMTEAILQAKP
ncbi:unnamed protein product [uncultured bacterium]|nr:unnamed protein product [uncultured bacterium]